LLNIERKATWKRPLHPHRAPRVKPFPEVYSRDLGVVTRIDVEEGELTVDFDGRDVIYGFGEIDELVLAYATTIHKSQGSKYPAVVIPLSLQHYPMLQRNLIYTGVTRRKRLVVLVA
jgi:exodeoxyribonuclease V alpha subunit